LLVVDGEEEVEAAPADGVAAASPDAVAAPVSAREIFELPASAAAASEMPDPDEIVTDDPAGRSDALSAAPVAPTGKVAMTAMATAVAKNTERFDTFVPPYNVAPSPTELALSPNVCLLTC